MKISTAEINEEIAAAFESLSAECRRLNTLKDSAAFFPLSVVGVHTVEDVLRSRIDVHLTAMQQYVNGRRSINETQTITHIINLFTLLLVHRRIEGRAAHDVAVQVAQAEAKANAVPLSAKTITGKSGDMTSKGRPGSQGGSQRTPGHAHRYTASGICKTCLKKRPQYR